MKERWILFPLTVFLSIAVARGQKKDQDENYDSIVREVDIETKDGIIIYGDLGWHNKNNTTIILFHQGRSNARGEYNYTLPRLHGMGYNVLAIDQRLGGDLYGSSNRTVSSNSSLKEKGYTYCDAQVDLEAALKYILRKVEGKIVLLGSSYSGTLAIRLAAKYKDSVDGVLAFSPSSGGPMAACVADDALNQYLGRVLVLRPEKEMQIESVQKQFEIVKESGKETYIAKNGAHGSSMLVEERVGDDVEKNWERVLKFLKDI